MNDLPDELKSSIRRTRVRILLVASPFVLVLLLLAWFMFSQVIVNDDRRFSDSGEVALNRTEQIEDISLDEFLNLSDAQLDVSPDGRLIINGELKANGAFILSGSETPQDPQDGQVFYNQDSNEIQYFDGDEFRVLISDTEDREVCFIGEDCGFLTDGDLPESNALPTAFNVDTLNNNGVVIGSGVNPLRATGAPSAGQVLMGNNQGIPTFTTFSGDIVLGSNGLVTIVDNAVGALALSASGVTAGTYGSSTFIPQVTVDEDGRITGVSDIAISGSGIGDILNNGQSGPITLGTNDPTQLSFETNNTDRLILDSAGQLTVTALDCSSNINGGALTANASGVISCSDDDGGGIASLNGQAGSAQTFANDTNITITSGANIHTLGWNGTLSVARGGTGASTAAAARTNLSAAASGANSDITSITGLTTDLSVSQGGTGVSSLTSNGVLYGNGSGAILASAAGTGGQVLLANGAGVPTFTTISGDISINATGSSVIQPNAVALSTDTTGNYLATLSGGNGIGVTGSGSEGATPSVDLGALTANWNQTGAFDFILDNANSELQIRGSGGAFYATLDASALTTDETYTLPAGAGGTICTTAGNCTGVGGTGDILNNGQTGPIIIGTNNASSISLESNNTTRLTFSDAGVLTLADFNCTSNLNGGALTVNGSGQVSCSDDDGGDGVGISSLNGLTAASQTFGNGTNVTITSVGSTHTLGWTGQLAISDGGTGSTTASGARTSLGAAASGANSDITSLTALTAITPSGPLTVGATTQALTLQGNGTTAITATDSGFTTTVGFITPTDTSTINFPNLPAGTYQVCTTQGNCLGGGGGGANTALSNLTGVAINTALLPGTTNSIDLGSDTTAFRDVYLTNTLLFEGSTADANETTIQVEDPSADVTYQFRDPGGGAGTYDICTTDGNCVGSGGGTAPNDAQYLVLAADSNLSNEQVLVAGAGLTLSTATLAIGAGEGITVNSDDITIDLVVATDGLSSTTSSGSGLEVLPTGLALIQGCSNGQILAWNEGTDVWECANDGGDGVGIAGLTLSGDSGTDQPIGDSDTIEIAGGTDIATSAGATDTITVTNNSTLASVTGRGATTTSLVNLNGGIAVDGTNFTVDGTTGAIVTAGDLAVNGGSITSSAATLVVNAGGDVDIQDALTVDSLTVDTGNINVVSGVIQTGGTTRITNSGVLENVSHANAGTFFTAGTLGEARGGTGLSSYATGDLLYASAANTLGALAVGLNNQCLIVNSGVPAWGSCTAGGGGFTNLTLDADSGTAETLGDTDTITITGGANISTSVGTTDTVTINFDGTLPVASGGTGSTTASGARTSLGAAASGANSDITSLTALTAITPSGPLTVGATTQALTLQGNGTTAITATDSGFTTTVGFITPTDTSTINFPNLPAGTYQVCTTQGNCLGGGGGGANTALSNLTGVAINTALLPGTTNSIDLGSDTTAFRDVYLTNTLLFEGSTADANETTIQVEDPSADVTYQFRDPGGGAGTYDICTTDGNCVGSGGGTAPNDAQYLVLAADSNLSNEQVLVAGAGLTLSTATLAIGAGEGITVNSDDITIDLVVATDGLSSTTSSGSGLEVLPTGLALIQGCSNGQILAWNEGTDVWECANDGGDGVGIAGLTLSGDSGTDQPIGDSDTIEIAGGTDIATSAGATDTITVTNNSTLASVTGRGATTTSLVNLNGGIAVDGTNFTVDGTTGAIVTAGTLSVTDLATFNGNLRIQDSDNTNYVTLDVSDIAGDYTVSVPAITANDTLCLAALGNCNGAGVDNEFTAVVATADSSNGASADYTADGTSDEDEINSAISAVNTAGGGIVFLLEGTYTIDGAINLASNVTLMGSGEGTQIVSAAGASSFGMVSANTVNNIEIRDLVLDGNSANVTGARDSISITNVGSGSGPATIPGFAIDSVHISDVENSGITITNAHNSSITNSTIVGGTNYGINFASGSSSSQITIADNMISGSSQDGILAYTLSSSIISGNIVEGTAGGISEAGITLRDGSFALSVDSNIIRNTNGVGLRTAGSGANNSLSITDNVFENNVNQAALLSTINNSKISNNSFYDNEDSGLSGVITIASGASNLQVVGNYIQDISGVTESFGILIDVGASNTYVADNSMNDTDGISDSSATTAYGGQLEDFTSSNANFNLQAPGTGTLELLSNTNITGTLTTTDTATFVGGVVTTLTGSIDPASSTAVVGVGTQFSSELEAGDRIVVSSETRTVVSITNDTNLIVDTAFSDNANDTSPDKLSAALRVEDTSGNIDFAVTENGQFFLAGIGECTGANGGVLTIDANNQLVCDDDDGAGAGNDLQGSYDAGTDGVIQLDGTRNGIFIQDASSTVGGIFVVENEDGSVDYLNVTSSATTVGGALITTGLATFDGNLRVADAGSDNYITINVAADESSDYTLSVPAEIASNDTFCLAAAGNCAEGSEFTYVVAASDSVNPSAADYVSDGVADEVQINAAITAANAAGGGIVYLMEGTFIVDTSVLMQDNVTLQGAGDGTVIRFADNTDPISMDFVVGGSGTVHDIVIRDLTIDANDDGQGVNDNVAGIGISAGSGAGTTSLRGGLIENVSIFDTKARIFDLQGSDHLVVDNIFADCNNQNSSTFSAILTSSTNVRITNSHIVDCSILLFNSANGHYSNNVFTNVGNAHPTTGAGVQLADGTFDHNIVDSSPGPGILVQSNSAITNSTITNTNAYASIHCNTGANITIEGNTITDAVNSAEGIELSGCSDVMIANNYIAGNDGEGIEVEDSASNFNITIDGNLIEDNTDDGIIVEDAATDVAIRNNQIAGNSTYGVLLSLASEVAVTNNHFNDNGGVGSTAALFIGGPNNQAIGNTFYDSAGTSDYITLGASAVGTYLADNIFDTSGTYDQEIDDGGTDTIMANQLNANDDIVLQASSGNTIEFLSDITTANATFNLLNANATTINAFGAGDTITVGVADGAAVNILNDRLQVGNTGTAYVVGAGTAGVVFGSDNVASGSGAATLQSGDVSDVAADSGALFVLSGDSSNSGNTGDITVQTGVATSGNSGNIIVDTGSASASAGSISIGTTNASNITLGVTSSTITFGDTALANCTALETSSGVLACGSSGGTNEFTAVVGTTSATNASSNVAAADYTADGVSDEDQINSAISAVNTAGGGTVLLLEGTYSIDGTITLLDDVEIIGSGTQATIIEIAGGTDTLDVFSESTNPENWAIRNLTIDINSDSNAGTKYGIDIDGTGALGQRSGIIDTVEFLDFHDPNDRAIRITNQADYLMITNSHFWNGTTAIDIDGDNTEMNIKISDNIFEDITTDGIIINDGHTLTVEGNQFANFDSGVGDESAIDLTDSQQVIVNSNAFLDGGHIGIEGDATTAPSSITITNNSFNLTATAVLGSFFDVLISGNTIDQVTGSQSGMYFVDSTEVTITGNTILECGNDGIELAAAGAGGGNSRFTITGNTIHGNTGYGVSLGTDAFDNTVSGNSFSSQGYSSIYINGADYNLISGNTITNSATDDGSYDGISILGDADYNSISGNSIFDTVGTGYAIDIEVSSVDNTYLADNYYEGTGASSINDLGLHTVYASQLDGSGNLDLQAANGGTIQLLDTTSISGSLTVNGTATPTQELDVRGNGVFGDGYSSATFHGGVANDHFVQVLSATEGDQVGIELYSNEGTNNRRATFYVDDTTSVEYPSGTTGIDISCSSQCTDFLLRDTGGAFFFYDEFYNNTVIGHDSQSGGLNASNTGSSGATLTVRESSSTATDDIFTVVTDVTSADNVVFIINADGSTYNEGASGTVATLNRTGNDGILIDFQQDGVSEGDISVAANTVSYNGFTGSHYGFSNTEQFTHGQLVRANGQNGTYNNNPSSEIVYGITSTSVENDPQALGLILAPHQPAEPISYENPYLIAAAGNGDLWVVDEGQDIEVGDYLISADTMGHARKDPRTDDISYIVGRAAEAIDWSTVTESVGGKKHKKISVYFEFFARDNASANLQGENLDVLGQGNITGDLLVGGNIEVAKDINVLGEVTTNVLSVTSIATVGGLVVNSDAYVNGNLSVAETLNVKTLNLEGKLISIGQVPTVETGDVLGGTDVVAIDGTDVAGTVVVTIDEASLPQSGEVAIIEFEEPYTDAPRINLTPTNAESAAIRIYAETTETGFTLYSLDDLQDDAEYRFDYFIIQSTSEEE